MKISEIKTFIVGNPWKNWVCVKVDTDIVQNACDQHNAFEKPTIHELGAWTTNGACLIGPD